MADAPLDAPSVATILHAATEAVEPAKIINLRCVDGEIVEIDTNIVKMIGVISDAYSSFEENEEYSLTYKLCTASIVRKVVEFCRKYLETPMLAIKRPIKSSDMKEIVKMKSGDATVAGVWYAEFCDMEVSALQELTVAVNYMSIPPCQDLLLCKIASLIRGKTRVQIRETFGLLKEGEPTEEEIIRVKERYPWFDPVFTKQRAAAAAAAADTVATNSSSEDAGATVVTARCADA